MILSRRHMVAAAASAIGAVGLASAARAACNQKRAPFSSINGPPEYLPGAPLRKSFVADEAAQSQRIKLFGKVMGADCAPLIGARLDFWQTDSNGNYDTYGHRFRGAQHTDQDGGYVLETLMPGPYNGARHVHFLLAMRVNNGPQPIFLSSAIFLPTTAEFAASKTPARMPEFIPPHTLETIGDVLMVPCDIILERSL